MRKKCHDAIAVCEEAIIDEHNCFEICMKHGIEFEIKEIDLSSKEAAKAWILDNQLAMCNLTDAARIEIVLKKEELLRERTQRNLTCGGGPKKCNEKPLSVSSKPEVAPSV